MGLLTKKLSKAEILAAEDRKIVDVEVPEWDGVVSLRPMTALDRHSYLFFAHKLADENGEIRPSSFTKEGVVKLLSMTMCDESGELMFTQDDIDRLAAKSAEAIARVYLVAQRINGLGKQAVEETVKN